MDGDNKMNLSMHSQAGGWERGEIINFLQNAKLFSSLYEGVGLPLIEAEGICPDVANNIKIFQDLSDAFENLYLINMDENNLSIAVDYLSNILHNESKYLSFKT